MRGRVRRLILCWISFKLFPARLAAVNFFVLADFKGFLTFDALPRQSVFSFFRCSER